MEVAAHMELKTSSVSNKRKRLHSADASIRLHSSRDHPHAAQCPASAATSSENSRSAMTMCQDLGHIPANSLGLMNQSMQKCPVSLDLKGDEISLNNNGGFSSSSGRKTKEFMESSETKRKKAEEAMESSAKKRQKVNSSMPSAEEIEEFFSAAERHEQERFAEKYNFDVVKDMPLEGRYLWVCLKP